MTETSGPRGRISLIKAVDEGRMDVLSPGFVHQMGECLDCRACAAACPSGVEYGKLIEGARARVEAAVAERRSPIKALARRIVLIAPFAHLWMMRGAARALRFYQRSGLQRFARASGILKRLGLEQAESLAPPISAEFFVPRGQQFKAIDERAKVMLHAGCIMHVAFAGVNAATVRVLQRNGCAVVVPAAQGCCGAIAVHAGEPKAAREMAKRNIAAFERSGAQFYIVNAAGCGSALKEYGELLKDDAAWADRAAAFAERVRDVLEFLDDVGLAAGLQPLRASVTYQDACHLVHAQRIAAAPRRLLRQIPELRLLELSESALCCGSAGIYNLTQPAMSQRLRDRKVSNVLDAGAEIVATANPGCAMQIAAGLQQKQSSIRVRHVVELLDESYAKPTLN